MNNSILGIDLVTSSVKMIQIGKDASVLEKTIAAALKYDHPKEEEWKKLRIEKGPEWILEEVCGLKKEDEISKNIMKYYKE